MNGCFSTHCGGYGGGVGTNLTETASHLATVGSRYRELLDAYKKFTSWITLYELAQAEDDVFRLAVRHVRPEMTRAGAHALMMKVGNRCSFMAERGKNILPRRGRKDDQTAS
jgi:hypothetical protein